MSRNKLLRFGLLAVMAVIAVRLFWIQIIQHDLWSERAAAQHTLQSVLVAKRGEIYMMDGDEPAAVVMNATVYTVIADPMLADEEELKGKLNELLGDKRIAEWNEVLADRTRRYYVVAKNVERKVAEKIAESDLAGVWLQANTKRVYPEGTLGSTVLGFVNAEGLGQYGVEGSFNEQLSGEDGLLKTVKDINNVALSIGDDNIKEPAKDGENIVLTLDKNIQYNVEKILRQRIQETHFANMSAVVMDPRDGTVLAMVNEPGYDPANYGRVESAEAYINHIVEDPFEPASVCKGFTFAAGMEYGVMTAETTFTNTGETQVDGWPIRNTRQDTSLLGTQTMQIALNYSLNTGSTQVLRWLGGNDTEITAQGRERLYTYYHDRFGLGVNTGVELYELPGYLTEPNADAWGLDSTYANMTFGQNMQATMLQVAAAYASLVNGGSYYQPTILAGKMVNGNFVAAEKKPALRRTISQETSAAMREMLYNTRREWRSKGTDAAGYYIGGKTGTAQVIRDGAYVLDETVGVYVGFGGTEGELPEYLIMVRIWEDGKYVDGYADVLPIFNLIKAYVQDYLKVRPKE